VAGFKEFVLRGNVVDLAVGVIIGAAFGGIVDSAVKDVISPLIGAAGGQPDFSAVTLGPIAAGNFLNAVIGFLIKAAVVYFVIVKPFTALMARLHPAPAAEAPPPPAAQAVVLLAEIRDVLKRQP
jgi:large conductance mechanosensitive channel